MQIQPKTNHLKRVLFLCIGNSCRSQMAEGFARRYGSDVMQVESAGLAPAQIVQPLTQKVMADKNIDIKDQFPKGLMSVEAAKFDLVVNMSGSRLPNMPVEVRQWKVADPIGETEDFYVTVRDQIENEVMRLIIEFRREMREKDGANRPTRKRRTHIVPPRNSEAPQP